MRSFALSDLVYLKFELSIGARLRGERLSCIGNKRSGIAHAVETPDAVPCAVGSVSAIERHLRRRLRGFLSRNNQQPLRNPRLAGLDYEADSRLVVSLKDRKVVFIA